MKLTTNRVDKKTVEITVEAGNDKLKKGLEQAYKDVAKKVNIPGFRKGKVPKQILLNNFGKEFFLEEAANHILPEIYEEVLNTVEEENMPLGRPQIEMVQLEEDKDFIFKIKADAKPQFEVGEYKGIELEKQEVSVSEEEVQKELERLQEKHSSLEVVSEDAKVKDGDTILLNFKGMVDKVPFEGGTAEDYNLQVGSKSFIEGFEEQLIGMALNEEKTIQVKFPEEYHSPDLAGKDAEFEVKINEIREKKLPELNDEFADNTSEFATLAELKEDLKKNILEAKEAKANAELKATAVEKVAANFDIEIPQAMVETQIDAFIQNMEMNMARQGLSLNQYLEYTNEKIEDLRAKYQADAETAVKNSLVLEAIAKNENIEISDEDLEKEFTRLAEMYKKEVSEIKDLLEKSGEKENMINSMKSDKAVDLIIANSK
ncbi:MAG: trigger factor [Eubacteriales bacterium]|nr:trigger factor [Eubacteriales bacterium]